jgi:pilus assembly protein CpaC
MNSSSLKSPITGGIVGSILLMMLLIAPGALAEETSLGILDYEIMGDSNQVELFIQGNVDYGYFPLSDPDRLVFDFPGTNMLLNNGELITQSIDGSLVSGMKLSQFAVSPSISRLVLTLTHPATANVTHNPTEGRLLITVIDSNSGNAQDTFVETENTTNLLAGTSTPTRTPDTSKSPGYSIGSTRDEVVISFPELTADRVQINKLRFPDRLHLRLFTDEMMEDIRPRFDSLERGTIWNSVAKQWSSYIDRDGLGIVDLTIYLYPDVGYTQSIGPDGVPEITLYKLAPADIEEGTIEQLDIAVESYSPDSQDDEITLEAGDHASLFTAPGETSATDTSSDTLEIIDGGSFISDTDQAAQLIEEYHMVMSGDEESGEVPDYVIAGSPQISASLPATNLIQRDMNPMNDDEVEVLDPMYMEVGEVRIITVDNMVRASAGNPGVATLNVISVDELLVTAISPGTTTLMTWEERGVKTTRMVYVNDANNASEREIAGLIGDDNISVNILTAGGTDGVILEGHVQTDEERNRAQQIAELFAGEGRVSNLIEVTDPSQVLVKVRVVEIDKRALDERLSQFSAGIRTDNDDFTFNIITNLLDPANPGGGLFDARTRPGIVNGDASDIVFDPIDTVLNELESNREARILSEPNVVALSGHEAHFRVGGEVPYSYVGENGTIIVEFKEFGIVLDMTPNVDSMGNISLHIEPTVRTVDMALAIAGIPGFRTREMSTDVQLQNGQTLVIGGLIQNEITEVISEVPLLADIPILGELFRSRSFTEDKTELVVFLTPYILRDYEDAEEIVDSNIEYSGEYESDDDDDDDEGEDDDD